MACAKHYIGNEQVRTPKMLLQDGDCADSWIQETQRSPFSEGFLGYNDSYTLNASVSSNIDDKTMHELYLWPWYDAVYAGVGSVMCSVS